MKGIDLLLATKLDESPIANGGIKINLLYQN